MELEISAGASFYNMALLQLAVMNKDNLLTTDLKSYNKLKQKCEEFVIIP
ncbi:MAG: hypothetical protein MPF33_05420 [Candidatus Aramenus sp.]|nr:hypothetical protein [Candidatus Aramenus sp.]